MDETNRRDIEVHLARVVRSILRDPGQFCRMDTVSEAAGYSRFHLTRMFSATIGESASQFARRIRLERATWWLQRSPRRIAEISAEAGFTNESAFNRAIRAEYGVCPRELRRDPTRAWVVASPSGLHWVSQWQEESDPLLAARFPIVYSRRAPLVLAACDHIGSYSFLGDAWAEHADKFEAAGLTGHPKVTIYHDNLWTYPTSKGMRSTLGAVIGPAEPTPPGFQRVVIPGGLYQRINRPIRRSERHDGWRVMTALQSGKSWSFDIYTGSPLPWDDALTEVWVSGF